MSDYHHLFSPLEIGPMQVRNRVLISAHVPGFAENNKPGKQYIAYHQITHEMAWGSRSQAELPCMSQAC